VKKFTVFLCAMLLVFLAVPAALAGIITYDDAYYWGFVEADWLTSAGAGDGGGQDDSDTTPFDVSVSVQFPSFAVVAESSIPDNANLYSEAQTRTSYGDPGAFSITVAEAQFFFTASTPAIRVMFDYGLGVEVEGFSNDASAHAYAALWLRLEETGGSPLFEGTDLEVGISGIDSGSDSDTGSFDELFSVTSGKEYWLALSTGEVATEVSDDATAYAYAEVTNFRVEAVPIPSSLLLLGSGLIGLVGLRKKLKK
jgi:hypothetical protein